MLTAFKYALFAAIATIINLTSQDVSLRLYSGAYSLYASIAIGTLTGLLTKYILDKKFIFSYHANSFANDFTTFFLYSFAGLFTTLIFWGTEIGFEFIFGSKWLRYLGAILGLTIGYLTKYQLDKRFVFTKPE